MTMNITERSDVATASAKQFIGNFTDETMKRDDFTAYVTGVVGRKKVCPSVRLVASYYTVEYLSSPAGLIVLAHHGTIDGQVDGIHPANLGKSITSFRNIIEPLKGVCSEAPAYNIHYMTRRSQGALVYEGFGRMVHGGDNEAPRVKSESHFTLEVYNTGIGPIVGAIESNDRVCVIRPNTA